MSDEANDDESDFSESASLEKAKELLECLENGDSKQAQKLILEMDGGRRKSIYQEIGQLTRELHDTLKAVSVKGVTERDG